MNAKEILAKLAEIDEMEALDGMNITEDVQEENEKAENKRKKRVYQAAMDAIEKLRDLLEEGIDPATGKLDAETEVWFDKLGEISGEFYSRAEAFNESLDEANTYTDSMLDNINVLNKTINSKDLDIRIEVREVNDGVAFTASGVGVQYHPYKPFTHETNKEELAMIVDKAAEYIEQAVNKLEYDIAGLMNARDFRKEN